MNNLHPGVAVRLPVMESANSLVTSNRKTHPEDAPGKYLECSPTPTLSATTMKSL